MKSKLPSLLIILFVLINFISKSTGSYIISSLAASPDSSLKNSTNRHYNSCTTQSCNDAVESTVKGRDPKIDPCKDFYRFACGSYLNSRNSSNVPNPTLELHWEEKISAKIEKQLTSSLAKCIDVNDTDPEKISKYLYQTCVNESAIEEQGLSPLLDIMEQVGGWPVLKENQTWNKTAFNWKRVVFKIGNASYWDNTFVPVKLYQNTTSTQFNIMFGEPTYIIPQHILNHGMKNHEVQNYFNYMVDMAVNMGASKLYATKELKQALQFEIKLAKIAYTSRIENDPTNSRDLFRKKITTSKLMKGFPFIPWDEYIKHQLPFNVTLDDMNERIMVYNLKYIKDLKNLLESTPKRVVANYVIWRNFDIFADHLNKNIRDIKANFENINNTLNKSRSKQCYEYISLKMPLVLSIIYVREYFDKNTESNVSIILNNVQDEFVEMLKNASWMDEVTRNRSIDKAININRIIGYPKELLDDSMTNKYLQDLQFTNDNYVANVFNTMIYLKKSEGKYFNPIVVNELKRWVLFGSLAWKSTPYYSPDGNVLFLPAGFLQNPFYSHDFPMYMKYGKVGFTLGHELAHSFDGIRRKFDKSKNVVDWPKRTDKKYKKKGQCFLERYSNYTGALVAEKNQNENIADNIGIKAAHYAYEKLSNMDKSETINGKVYTPKKMFWISYASIGCGMQTEDLTHNTSKIRVIGPLSNMKEFARDFNCRKNSRMNPPKKCRIL